MFQKMLVTVKSALVVRPTRLGENVDLSDNNGSMTGFKLTQQKDNILLCHENNRS